MSGRNFGRKEVPIDPTKIPPGIDASTFFSPQIPDEIRVAVPFMHETPIEIIQSSLQKIISSILANSITDEEFLAFQTELTQQQESFGIVFTALFCILKTAVSAKVTGASISADLISMNIPAAVVENICQAIHASRSTVESRVVINRVGFPTLANLRWRIDVTISSGSLSRVMRPSILMQVRPSFFTISSMISQLS